MSIYERLRKTVIETFELAVGEGHYLVRVEEGEQAGTFKIYAAGQLEDWIDYKEAH